MAIGELRYAHNQMKMTNGIYLKLLNVTNVKLLVYKVQIVIFLLHN